MRLNQYIAHAGVCAGRKAERLILAGEISINEVVVKDLAYQVQPTDMVCYRQQPLQPVKKCYYLLHKPLNMVTTLRDPEGRRSIFDFVRPRIKTRVYPVGRLDRNTTGLLLLTNDGLLAWTLSHPAHGVPKVYQITLKSCLQPPVLARLRNGVTLADGFVRPDAVVWQKEQPKVVQVTLHSGKNRVLRRIFDTLDHQIMALERIAYGGIRGARLLPGQWRSLNSAEIASLQAFM